jgi:glucosamine 6-phosphate synthetase-like amidotransferase/phosphosugar isomerase protein
MHHDPNGLDLFEEDILRQGGVISEASASLRAEAEAIAATVSAPSHVYLVGCGDSFDAGIAARYVWEGLLGVPVEAVSAMTFATSVVDLAPEGALVVGLSVSGRVSRVVEALRAASGRGLRTLAITMNAASPFAQEPSTATWIVNFTKLGAVPGTSSHLVGALAMYELGCALAGASSERDELRGQLDQLDTLVSRAVTECAPTAKEHADVMARERPVLLIGYGPSMSPARFTVRKMLELTQLVTFWQETEEYAHDEYSLVDSRFRVIQLAPPDRGRTRNAEIARYLKRLDVHLAIVTDGAEADVHAEIADIVYRLPACPPALAPLLYAIPGQLLALETARRLGGSLYGMAEKVHREDGDPQIYESEIVA